MATITISENSDASELKSLAFTLHHLLQIPTTIRSLNKKGLRIEKNKIVDNKYTGPILEECLSLNKTIRTVPKSGVYKGKAVVVSPLRDKKGNAIIAIGVVDIVTSLDISSTFKDYLEVITEIEVYNNK
ncbi:MAG: DUF2111 domain-containing protein [Methanosarcinaceae archaeon]|nr:DUF2111 domain-containing protein [Methanosarcinaceae archaeon]